MGMKLQSIRSACLAALLLVANARAETSASGGAPDLTGTTWQVVAFEGGNGKKLLPADKTRYTVAFSDGRVHLRIACNRGGGTWMSPESGQVEFGPLTTTRMACQPPNPLNDRIFKDWLFVRSYMVRDGRLFLSLIADKGIYELEPAEGSRAPQPAAPATSPSAPAPSAEGAAKPRAD
jgi:para-nitrobenzyl esterase